jgi:cell wall-associated NlpC family hydrolase
VEEFNKYVGIPWVKGGHDLETGCDCWGLVVRVLHDEFGIIIKEYEGSKASGQELTDIISEESKSDSWDATDVPQPGDLCVMAVPATKRPEHIGLYIGNGFVLHSLSKSSAISSVSALSRVFKGLEYYRRVS